MHVLLPLLLQLTPPASAQDTQQPRRVALVVGISSYENLPDEVSLNYARSDAATVAAALEGPANYDVVLSLSDRQATRSALLETLRTKVAQEVTPDDHLLVYFVGHGLGADLDAPTLLTYDSTLENGHKDGLELGLFASELHSLTQPKQLVVVTDAIHDNQLNGLFFYGPAANQWPAMPAGVAILSSSSASEGSRDGVFGSAFADAISGAADLNGDTRIDGKEMLGYLKSRLTIADQTPLSQASDDKELDTFTYASGVVSGRTIAGGSADNLIFADHRIHAAKFVFEEGASASVQCRATPIRACDPICYVRDFTAGPCQLTAIVEGREAKGTVLVHVPGKYSCSVHSDGRLACTPPPSP